MKIKILLIAIIILGFFLRFYKLGEIPNGLYQDETAIGWNAYSLLQTQKDEYGRKFPLYFKSFGDYKLPVYIYLTTISVNYFGLTPLAVRLPSALFGFLTIPLFYLLVKKIFKMEFLSVLMTLLLTVNPWHLHYSRATFEVSIVLFLFTLGTLLFHYALEKRKGTFFASIICFIVALYTYNLTRLLSPLVVLGLLFIHKKGVSHISRSEKILTFLAGIILLSPFIFTYSGQGGVSSASGTLIFSSAAVNAPLLEFRSYFVGIPIINKVVFNSATLVIWQYILNILSYLSVSFFFITGSNHGNHGIGTDGQLYIFELPFIAYGIYTFLKTKDEKINSFFLIAIATIFSAALTRESPQATRSFTLLLFFPVISAYGFVALYKRIRKEQPLLQYLTIVLFIGVSIFSIIHYFSSYYVRFPIAYAKQWREQDKVVVQYIKEQWDTYDHIVIDKDAGFIYSSLLFYLPFPPNEFQQSVVRAADDTEGMSEVISFGKISYQEINSKTYNLPPHTLLITTIDKSSGKKIVKTFTYPIRPVVIALKQNILQYPTQETAYVAISSDTQ